MLQMLKVIKNVWSLNANEHFMLYNNYDVIKTCIFDGKTSLKWGGHSNMIVSSQDKEFSEQNRDFTLSKIVPKQGL